jgi:hypothetical protein
VLLFIYIFLGPVLFLLYINALPLNTIRSKITFFADDTNILVSEENINKLQYKINRVTNQLQTWFKLNNLVVNTEKTLVITFHSFQNKKSMLPHAILEGRDVPYNTETKFLGIYINKNTNWNNHIKYLSSKLSPARFYCQSFLMQNFIILIPWQFFKRMLLDPTLMGK